MSKAWEVQLGPQEAQAYKQLFHAASKTQPNIVTGQEAVQFFAKSGLNNTLLSEVNTVLNMYIKESTHFFT